MSKSVSLHVESTNESKNTCGGCTACCDVLTISWLGKPSYSRCKHLVPGTGCGIYAERPTECSFFRCAWLAGVLGEGLDRRPDHLGLMFDLNPVDTPPRLNVWEVTPGALNRENLEYLIKKVREHKLVRHVRFGHPAVILFPYGSKMGVKFDINSDFSDWTPPASGNIMPIRPRNPAKPDIAIFTGEIEPLRLPKESSSANTAATTTQPKNSET